MIAAFVVPPTPYVYMSDNGYDSGCLLGRC